MKRLPLWALLGVAACAGAEQNQEPAAAPAGQPAEATEAHLLSGCGKKTGEAGLELDCAGFKAILGRLTSSEPINDAILTKVENDMLSGMRASIRGEVTSAAVSISNGEQDVSVTGFEVRVPGKQAMPGVLMALALNDSQVLTVTCFATEPSQTPVCPRVMEQVLSRGLPQL